MSRASCLMSRGPRLKTTELRYNFSKPERLEP